MWHISIDRKWDGRVFGTQLYSMRLMFYSEAEAREEFAERLREYIPKGAAIASLAWKNDPPIVRWHGGDDVPEVNWDEFCPHGHRENPCEECEYEEAQGED